MCWTRKSRQERSRQEKNRQGTGRQEETECFQTPVLVFLSSEKQEEENFRRRNNLVLAGNLSLYISETACRFCF
jgi:hypothetical protein